MTNRISYIMSQVEDLLDRDLQGDITETQIRRIINAADERQRARAELKAELQDTKRRLKECEKALRMLYNKVSKYNRLILVAPRVFDTPMQRAGEYLKGGCHAAD